MTGNPDLLLPALSQMSVQNLTTVKAFSKDQAGNIHHQGLVLFTDKSGSLVEGYVVKLCSVVVNEKDIPESFPGNGNSQINRYIAQVC